MENKVDTGMGAIFWYTEMWIQNLDKTVTGTESEATFSISNNWVMVQLYTDHTKPGLVVPRQTGRCELCLTEPFI